MGIRAIDLDDLRFSLQEYEALLRWLQGVPFRDCLAWDFHEAAVFTLYGLSRIAHYRERLARLTGAGRAHASDGNSALLAGAVEEISGEIDEAMGKVACALKAYCPLEVLGVYELAVTAEGLQASAPTVLLYASSQPVVLCVANESTAGGSVRIRIELESGLALRDETFLLRKRAYLFVRIPNRRESTRLRVTMERDGGSASLDLGVQRPPSGVVHVEAIDAETRARVPVRATLEDGRGNYFLPLDPRFPWADSTLDRPTSFYVGEPFAIELPLDGSVRLRATRGFEYREADAVVDPAAMSGNDLRLEMHRWISMPREGWYGGETHLHSNRLPPLHDLSRWAFLPDAEGLNVAWIQRWVCHGQEYAGERPMGEHLPAFRGDCRILFCEEFRNDVYGHLCILNIRQPILPVSTGRLGGKGKPDYPPNAAVCDEAHRQGGIVIAHSGFGQTAGPDVPAFTDPGSFETPVDLALGKLDLVEVNGPDVAGEWYTILNCGFRIPASTGPDFVLSDCSRVYVQVEGAFDLDAWLHNLRRGRSFLTNGPLIFLTIDGSRPGDVVHRVPADGLPVRCVALGGRFPLARLELVHNGEVIRSLESARGDGRLAMSGAIRFGRSGWVAARCMNADRSRWAHTNPVYLEMPAANQHREESARELLETVGKLRRWVDARARFENPRQKAEVLDLCARAEAFYRNLLASWQPPRRAT